MNNQAAPPGYTVVKDGKRVIVVKAELEQELRPLMTRSFGELAGRPDARKVATGRAVPVHIPVEGGSRRIFIRPYAHGGLLARFMGRDFRNPSRAFRELAVSHSAQSSSLPIPPLVGITAEQMANGRWRMEAWSWWIPNATALSLCLPSLPADGAARRELMAAVARALKVCHDAGLVHRDLNSRNIVVERVPNAWEVRVIDLDGASMDPPLSWNSRLGQLKRLFRSFAKENVLPRHLSMPEFAAFVRTYSKGAISERALASFLASCRRTAYLHSVPRRMLAILRPLFPGNRKRRGA